jgi:hypothetical protein
MLLALKCPTATQISAFYPILLLSYERYIPKKTSFFGDIYKKRQYFGYKKLRRKKYE